MENVLIYTQDHPTLGAMRLEVIPQGYAPTIVITYMNGLFVGRTGVTADSLARFLKGYTLTERVVR